ncbi:MAG: NUDIX hydrolase [Anaerolineaceae bacterium]|nr:NUDIX hydrolase [Anaerolineaceae bacterium]
MKSFLLRPWKTLSRETILNHNKFLSVENHVVELPDGRIIPDWSWVKIPDASIVLAMTEDEQFICFRQIRYAVEGTTLATVGGMIEENEDPLEAAKRELLEESGYAADEWVRLGKYILDPNRGVANMHLFLALGAKQVSEPIIDDLEDQDLILLSHEEIEKALLSGEFQILTSTVVISMSLNYLHSQKRQK